MKILIFNEAGSPNIGDKAIGEGVRVGLKRICGSKCQLIEIGLQSGSYLDSSSNYVPTSEKGYSNNKFLREKFLPFYHFLWTLRYLLRIIPKVLSHRDADFAFIGGGGIVMNNHLQFPTAFSVLTLLCSWLKIPIFIVGVSVSSTQSRVSKLLFSYSLRKAKSIFVRDPISREILYRDFEIKADMTADFAFLNDVVFGDAKKNVLVNVSSVVLDKKKYLVFLKRLLHVVNSENVRLVTTGEPEDYQLALEIAREFNIALTSVINCHAPKDYMTACANSKLVIASRLHGGILPIRQNSNVFILELSEKHVGFFKGVGLDDRVLSLDSEDFSFLNFEEKDFASISDAQYALAMSTLSTIISSRHVQK